MATGAGSAPTRKVLTATSISIVTAFVLWLLGAVVFHGDVPAPVSDLVIILVPGLAGGITAWWVRDVEKQAP